MKKKSTSRKDGLWTASYGEIGATLKTLQDYGVTLEHLARLRAEPEYAKQVARFILSDDLRKLAHLKLMRTIMGKNFFGAENWSTFYGATFTEEQLRQIANFPWSKNVINGPCPFNKGQLVKDTHFAFLGISSINGSPLTVDMWLRLHSAKNQPKIFNDFNGDPDWWRQGYQSHIDMVTMQLRWYLSLKNVVSNYGTYWEKVAMLPPEYEVSSTIAEVTKVILFFRNTGEHLNRSQRAICAERTGKTIKVIDGLFSTVDYYDEHGLYIGCWDGHRPSYDIGLAVFRKPGV